IYVNGSYYDALESRASRALTDGGVKRLLRDTDVHQYAHAVLLSLPLAPISKSRVESQHFYLQLQHFYLHES
ncbi:MAG: hypothetical protein LC770_14210, partial [Acidobacteria bacterium]|nr:hypothetical protein [Acidobacteriota bacterium]